MSNAEKSNLNRKSRNFDSSQLGVYQKFIDSLETVALLLRPITREIVAVNKTGQDLGITPGSRCYEAWSNRDKPCPGCQAPELWESGETVRCQVESERHTWDSHWTRISDDLYLHFAHDITDDAKTVESLRRSEKLHRITLDNITDAVFLTDASDRFTYICSNVHFIFGHSREEVTDMGTMTNLLGGNIFSHDDLNRDGELLNIEQRVVDKEGAFHDLLINIKRVSIEDGTVLYSCRDITDRKAAERALHAEHIRFIEGQLALENKNTALSELVEHVEREKKELALQIRTNMDRVVGPVLARLETQIDDSQVGQLNVIRSAINDMTSPFIGRLEQRKTSLTLREIEICNLIKTGYSSKDVANTLNTSESTVKTQRKIIRRKLGLVKSKDNLATYLKQL